ncbi:hypothetical protein MST22_17545 [Virgibacillus halodenitrificans]|uniref:hypothetical protein n=1 Tax=Virgibacillus halodenitrificans TaxID=1482 RepID=UPI001FB32387|nr:hypothetical protein [Virgibacillus halodenitrificans]MCJ0932959.1 hypothetical protein [Virgibacillus halodenitrificans]
MNYSKHFLGKDIQQAKKERYCIHHLLGLIVKEIEKGDFISASFRANDMLQSIGELNRMSTNKYREDKFQSLMDEMAQRGIDIQVVRRKIL